MLCRFNSFDPSYIEEIRASLAELDIARMAFADSGAAAPALRNRTNSFLSKRYFGTIREERKDLQPTKHGTEGFLFFAYVAYFNICILMTLEKDDFWQEFSKLWSKI